MDVPNSNQKFSTCPEHNQPIILQDLQANKGSFCFFCIQNFFFILKEIVPPNEIEKQQQELFNQQKIQINEEKQQLQSALDAILNYKNYLNQSLDKIIREIIDQIEIMDEQVKSQQELVASIEKLKSEYLIQKQRNLQERNLVKSQLLEFQLKYCNVDKILELLDDQSKEVKFNEIKDSRKFQYELINESNKTKHLCCAFAFNQVGNLLIVGCGKQIIIYQFLNGQMTKEIQRLTTHTEAVYCLHFQKQSNSFVSGSCDHSIIIWELDTTNKWIAKTQLKEHENWVLCIQMNKKEDILISGSQDKTVKFWRNINNQWSCQQTLDLEDCSQGLSLNKQENILISCGDKPFIQVMQLQSENSWSVVQIIQVAQDGKRLGFLNGDQFIFQPRTQDFLEMYKYEAKSKQFQKFKQNQIQSCEYCSSFFPIQFIKDLKIVTVKHGKFINIFKVNDNNDLTLLQTIEFWGGSLFGLCSDDGKYIATWDWISKAIQIRQLRFLE